MKLKAEAEAPQTSGESGGGGEGGGTTDSQEQDASSAGEVQRRARELFSDRCQKIYGSVINQLSDGGTLLLLRKKIRHEHRAQREQRYTFVEWIRLKSFLERYAYGTSWGMPIDANGLSFSNWITGLRPYVENTLQDELLTILNGMRVEQIVDLEQALTDLGEAEKGVEIGSFRMWRAERQMNRFRHALERALQIKRNGLASTPEFNLIVQKAIGTALEGMEKAEGTRALADDESQNAMETGSISGLSFAASTKLQNRQKAGPRVLLSTLQGESLCRSHRVPIVRSVHGAPCTTDVAAPSTCALRRGARADRPAEQLQDRDRDRGRLSGGAACDRELRRLSDAPAS